MRRGRDTKYITVRRGDILIRADYTGGPYIDLTFGSEGHRPTEVINVWDYEANRAEPPLDRWDELTGAQASAAVRAQVVNWMRSGDEENPGWYDQYMENARYA